MKPSLATTLFLAALTTRAAQQRVRKLKGHSKRVKGNSGSMRPSKATNVCTGSKIDIDNHECVINGVIQTLGQARVDVSLGYNGELDMTDQPSIIVPFYEVGICPVNVHWHLGADHRSEGEFDENGTGPHHDENFDDHRQLAGDAPLGLRCNHYDEDKKMFTKKFKWGHCVDMKVGETYEIHWPHPKAGACGTLKQWDSPFYDGLFCHAERLDLSILQSKVGVQAQAFTIVNDDSY